MHVQKFLHKVLGGVIHKRRLDSLSEVVLTAIKIKEVNLTRMGRSLSLPIQERSGIQKVNRLLGNEHLRKDKIKISKEIAELLIGNKGRAEIIVDWTKYPRSKDAVLRAALVSSGRALTLYEERHSEKSIGNGRIQKAFLKQLKWIIPKGCKLVIITDAGFHNPWFKEVLKLGWDYIGRIRGLKHYSRDGKDYLPCSDLYKFASEVVSYEGKVILTRKNKLETNFYLVKAKLKGRKNRTKTGAVRKDKDSKAYSRSYREPWLLASSLKGRLAAKKVEKIYARRMTIEESFRDLKSSRYGLGLNEGRTRRKGRRDVLLLIAMLASIVAWLAGRLGEELNLQYQFQSNSVKHRRVISLFYLGCQLIRKNFSIFELMKRNKTSLRKVFRYV